MYEFEHDEEDSRPRSKNTEPLYQDYDGNQEPYRGYGTKEQGQGGCMQNIQTFLTVLAVLILALFILYTLSLTLGH